MPDNRAVAPGMAEWARFTPPAFIFALFFGSGCAALIYQVVWLQLLQLIIGASAYSLGVLLATFMGGMGLGSIALPRLLSNRHHPLRVYAVLELGIGLFALLFLWGLPVIEGIYTAFGHGRTGMALRGLLSAACLLPPTILMGATLPAIARWVNANPRGVSWLGFFYGGNIAGAVAGCLLAGFCLLRVRDMAFASYFAAAINTFVALAALALARHSTRPNLNLNPDSEPPATAANAPPLPGARAVYIVIGLSGMSALAAEVVWTRTLSLLLGGTVYTFSIILAVFLGGLGIGSAIGSALARSLRRPRLALAVCQASLMFGIAWTAYVTCLVLPQWPVDPSLSRSPWINFQLDLARCLWAMTPATLAWGASFPLAIAAVIRPGTDPARNVGQVYAANTLGAILGALAATFALIPTLGASNTQSVLIASAALAALIAAWPPPLPPRQRPLLPRLAWSALLLLTWFLLARNLPHTPASLVAYGRYTATYTKPIHVLFQADGVNASVAVTELDNGVRNFHVSGKVEASSEPQDMRLQRMLGHLPALLHPNPKSILIVGCGAGVTAGTFVLHPNVERIVLCEIEPLIPQAVAPFFREENHRLLEDPRVEIVYDDGRHFVRTTRETFDIVTSDPIHPWVKGSATLYSREYFEMVKRRLKPGGVVSQWVPLYESSESVVKSEFATFLAAFPNGTIWSNDLDGEGYDVVLLGRAQPGAFDLDAMFDRWVDPRYAAVTASLRDVDFRSALALLGTYTGRGDELAPWLAGAEINRDANLRLQYLAGLDLNATDSNAIHDHMISVRTFPAHLFLASESRLRQLRAILK